MIYDYCDRSNVVGNNETSPGRKTDLYFSSQRKHKYNHNKLALSSQGQVQN